MLQGTYTAAMGINAQQQRLDTIGNNLANANTNAFKSTRANFKDALYSVMTRPIQPQNDVDLQLGHGTLVSGFTRSFTQGLYQETGINTDVLIEGEGFFAVQATNGETMYTRDGHFEKSVEADGVYLRLANGNYVLGTNGQRIRIPQIAGEQLKIGTDGSLAVGNNPPFAQLQIVTFPNLQGLNAVNTNLYAVSETSGQPTAVAQGGFKLITGALEGSNVNLPQEFALLIRTQRAMQLSSRALSTSDQMDETAINTRQ